MRSNATMRAALTAAALSCAAGSVEAQSVVERMSGLVTVGQASPASARPDWGALDLLARGEWSSPFGQHRFVWTDPDRVLSWQQKNTDGSWSDFIRLTAGARGVEALSIANQQRGSLTTSGAGASVIAFRGAPSSTVTLTPDGERFSVFVTGATPQSYALTPVEGGSTEAAARPSGPIIVQAAAPPAAPRTGRAAQGPASPPPRAAPALQRQAPYPPATAVSSGPIVIASAPPPPAAMRTAPRPAVTAAPRPAAPTSREAQMAAQVEIRRVEDARQAEAERLRQQQIAYEAQQAEQARRSAEEARSAGWSEAFGFLGAVVGGAAMGMQTGGDMGSITAGMALGSMVAAPDSEIAAAASQNLQVEHARMVAEQEAAAELHRRTMAAMNDPNNPLTQQQRREGEAREERQRNEREEMEREHKAAEEREAADREALMAELHGARETADDQAREDRAKAEEERTARERQAQREAEARQREADRRREEEEARRAEADRLRQEAEEARRREEEEARQAAERRRMERERMMRTGNASGGYNLLGLPEINRSSDGPGRGTTTVSLDHIGGCRATGATVRYNLGILMGEAVVGGSISWTGEEGCSLPVGTDAWIKVQWGSTYGWVTPDATPGSANGGFGYNSPGSPAWSQLLCGFEGGRPTTCMDADSAKRLWTNGTITEVRIGW